MRLRQRDSPIHPKWRKIAHVLRVLRKIRAPIDVQRLAGNEPGILGRQKQSRASDLVWLRHATERDRAGRLGDLRLATAIARLGCIGEPGRDRTGAPPSPP